MEQFRIFSNTNSAYLPHIFIISLPVTNTKTKRHRHRVLTPHTVPGMYINLSPNTYVYMSGIHNHSDTSRSYSQIMSFMYPLCNSFSPGLGSRYSNPTPRKHHLLKNNNNVSLPSTPISYSPLCTQEHTHHRIKRQDRAP